MELNKKGKAILVASKENYLIMSLKERLNEGVLSVSTFSAENDAISKMNQKARAIILYMDADLVQNTQVLVFIKDMALEQDIPIFTIGSHEELEHLRALIPQHLVQAEYERPVNVREIADKIDSYMQSVSSEVKKKILVVDDSSMMLHNMKGWLSKKYHVALADSGISAIKSISLSKPDLIILDYEMPIVNGKQVLQMIRSEMEFSDIPVIFLTGRSDRESVVDVMALKPAGYLLKSMKPIEIVDAINLFFDKQKAKMV